MSEPRATLDDLYSQNNTIIGHLERLNENIFLLRETVYGQTSEESGKHYGHPKHDHYGMATGEQLDSIESSLGEIAKALTLR